MPVAVAVYGDVAATLFTLNVLVPVPPVALKVIDPLEPKQLGFVPFAVKTIAVGILIVTSVELVQPFASVASIV